MENNSKLNVLVVGATGLLGGLITKHCLKKENLIVNILVRDRKKNPELVAQVENAGGRVIQGDLAKPSTLRDCTKGMHTVISAISALGKETAGNFEIMVDGQTALVEDCVRNKVTRFLPSNYGLNYEKFSPQEISDISTFFGVKVKFFDWLATQPIKVLHLKVGLFLEYYFETHEQNGFGYWGDMNQMFSVTSYEDAARITAAAVSRENQDGVLTFIGENLTFREIVDTYNRVRQTEKEPKRFGSFEDLKKIREEKIREGLIRDADMLGVDVVVYDQRSKFEANDNKQYPEVKPTSFRDFLVQNPQIQLP